MTNQTTISPDPSFEYAKAKKWADRIVELLQDKKKFRNDVAVLYGELIDSEMKRGLYNYFDWKQINQEIIIRWSKSGLLYIKEKAWKLSGWKMNKNGKFYYQPLKILDI